MVEDRIIEIDLKDLIKKDININEYLTLVKLEAKQKGNDIPFYTTDNTLNSLEEKRFIKIVNGNLYLAAKGLALFDTAINFDDIFLLYPAKTPDGRILRANNKEVNGNLTRDYKVLSKKYSSCVKNQDQHNNVVQWTKNMINDYVSNRKLMFMPKLETYINQRGWERYADYQENNFGENMERL